uniref:Uncharacterized protein n=1 Tax=Prevotella sp. GTC17262 TaxID=3236797 RepID=A0AB33JJS5_9BACT
MVREIRMVRGIRMVRMVRQGCPLRSQLLPYQRRIPVGDMTGASINVLAVIPFHTASTCQRRTHTGEMAIVAPNNRNAVMLLIGRGWERSGQPCLMESANNYINPIRVAPFSTESISI